MEYTVQLYTDGRRGSQEVPDIKLQLYGVRGDTGMRHLHSQQTKRVFQPGKVHALCVVRFTTSTRYCPASSQEGKMRGQVQWQLKRIAS